MGIKILEMAKISASTLRSVDGRCAVQFLLLSCCSLDRQMMCMIRTRPGYVKIALEKGNV